MTERDYRQEKKWKTTYLLVLVVHVVVFLVGVGMMVSGGGVGVIVVIYAMVQMVVGIGGYERHSHVIEFHKYDLLKRPEKYD